MNKFQTIALVGGTLATMLMTLSCNSNKMRANPGKNYMPDMIYSRAYDSYTSNPNFADGMTNRVPVEGTVPYEGALPDHMSESDTSIYAMRTVDYKFSAAEVEEGARLYNIQCGICHGANMDGQGPLYTSGKFAAMPANLKDPKYLNMSVGQIYHAIKFGKNMMGSYSSHLTVNERWQVIAYIKKVQSENGGAPFTMGDESNTTTTALATDSTANSDTATAAN